MQAGYTLHYKHEFSKNVWKDGQKHCFIFANIQFPGALP
jgi:hypothetical protein